MASSIRDIGRQPSAGSPDPLIRRAYPLCLVAVVVVTARGRCIYLAEHVDAPEVARVLLHLETDHAVSLGAAACYAPACAVAVELGGGDAETVPAPIIALSG
jgi:hypothetical protein